MPSDLQMVDGNTIGDIISVVCKRVGGFPAVEPKTDVIIDLAVHDVDIVNYLLGKKPKSISSHGSRTRHSKKIDSAEILMNYGRASGFIQANWLTPVKIRTIALTGSFGYLEANYITQELTYYKHNMKEIQKDGFTEFVLQVGDPEKRVIKVDFEEPLAAELKAFMAKSMGRTAAIVDPGSRKKVRFYPRWSGDGEKFPARSFIIQPFIFPAEARRLSVAIIYYFSND